MIDGYNDILVIGFIIAAILVVIFGIWGAILQWSILFRYQANNRKHIGGATAKQVAEQMLQSLGYGDVQVRRASYFWMFFFTKWGNRYSPRRNSIFLYGNILNNDTVTAIALATQKVGLVIQHRNGEPKMKFRAKWELWTRMAPNLFLPIVTIGVIIDLVVNGAESTTFGYITMGFVALAIIWTLIGFYALYLIIPTERRAGELALGVIKQHNLIPAQFIPNVEAMYRTYVKKYIADFVLALLELIMDLLWLAMKLQSKRK
jgi:Zn-dependent membrane protease YugP